MTFHRSVDLVRNNRLFVITGDVVNDLYIILLPSVVYRARPIARKPFDGNFVAFINWGGGGLDETKAYTPVAVCRIVNSGYVHRNAFVRKTSSRGGIAETPENPSEYFAGAEHASRISSRSTRSPGARPPVGRVHGGR